MLPEAHVSHCTTNRLRIKIPSKKRSAAFFRTMEECFATLPGIESVEANPLTGSVLVSHHSDERSIREWIQKRRIVSLKEVHRKRTTLRQDITRGAKTVNTRIASVTGGQVDLWDVAGLSLLSAGIYQLLKGNFMAPAWYTLFWYAFGLLSKGQSSSDDSGE